MNGPDPLFFLAIQDRDWKDIIEAASAATTAIALAVGGFWAWLRFIKNRLRYPRADLSHEVFFKALTPQKTLVHVTVIAANVGGVLLPITKVWTTLYQITPVSDEFRSALDTNKEIDYEGAEITWPAIGHHEIQYKKKKAEIEPGEFQRLDFQFVVDEAVETISVYTFFVNSVKAGPGWCRTTLVDVPKRS